jgi:hypothetical protein
MKLFSRGYACATHPVISQMEGEGFVSILWYKFKDTYIPAQQGTQPAGLSSLHNNHENDEDTYSMTIFFKPCEKHK